MMSCHALCNALLFFCVFTVEGFDGNQLEDVDRILDLPGLSQQPSFNQYSGYLDAIGGNKLHYWFVESESSPSNDPLVIWFNGGPGCSSLIGMLEGNGPFRVKEDGRTLEMNPHRWNQIANMLYIESPVGVGFSYNTEANHQSNDITTRDNNYAAIKEFLRKFSRFSRNPLYIFGQSYGGIYVPMLSALIVDDPEINFKGFGVGNGFVSKKYIDSSMMYFIYYHGYIGDKKWDIMQKECCTGSEERFCDFTTCKNGEYVYETFHQHIGFYNNAYSVGAMCTRPSLTDYAAMYPVNENIELTLFDKAMFMGYHCINSTATIMYLNKPAVQRAIHIPHQQPGISEWNMCIPHLTYNRTEFEMADNFLKVLSKEKRVLLYYGELDIICNFLGGRWFVESLNQEVVTEHEPWFYRDENDINQVGGGFDEYRNLRYVSVKGGGHMVLKDTADKAFIVFKKFITNTSM